MRKILFTAGMACFLFTACNSNDSSLEKISYDSSIVTSARPAALDVQAPITATVDSTALVTNKVVQTLPPNANTTAVTNTGMNPPHGQPGHRCDIAVGAPLNSAPAAPAAAVNSAVPGKLVTQPTITQNPVKTLPGMNPPHGQPGHRCDIAVGAPLNSAPATPVKTESKTTEATPVNNDASKAKTDSSGQ